MKRIKIIGIFISFILSIILHFIYGIFPNTVISIIAPVNESIWEHMKLIVTSSIIFSILEYFIYKKKKIKYNNFILSYAISSIIGVFLYLLIYIPIVPVPQYKSNTLIYFFSFTVSSTLSYKSFVNVLLI